MIENKMKKTYLHIGPHKTGSTYIQKTLFDNISKLREVGINYPDTMIGTQWGHHDLVEAVRRGDRELIENFVNSLESVNVISSENFENFTADQIDSLLNYFVDHEIHVVYFKRNYSDLLVSAWQEHIKHGGVETWSEYILLEVLRPFSGSVLNGKNILEVWAKKEKITQIHVLGYDHLLEDKKDISQVLLEIVTDEILDPTIFDGKKVNASMNLKKIEVIRILNKFAISSGFTVNHNVRTEFLRLEKQNPELVSDAIASLSFAINELNLQKCWAIDILEDDFYNGFSCERPKNILDKFHLLPQVQIDSSGHFGDAFMALSAEILKSL